VRQEIRTVFWELAGRAPSGAEVPTYYPPTSGTKAGRQVGRVSAAPPGVVELAVKPRRDGGCLGRGRAVARDLRGKRGGGEEAVRLSAGKGLEEDIANIYLSCVWPRTLPSCNRRHKERCGWAAGKEVTGFSL
jgi:hypothetical protein